MSSNSRRIRFKSPEGRKSFALGKKINKKEHAKRIAHLSSSGCGTAASQVWILSSNVEILAPNLYSYSSAQDKAFPGSDSTQRPRLVRVVKLPHKGKMQLKKTDGLKLSALTYSSANLPADLLLLVDSFPLFNAAFLQFNLFSKHQITDLTAERVWGKTCSDD